MSEEREISLDQVVANTLDKADALNPGEEGFTESYKAVDIVLKNNNDAEKNAILMEQINSNERIEMAKIKAEEARIEAEKVQHEEDNRLREEEIKAAKLDSFLKSTVIVACIGEVSYHVGMAVIGKFEESGTFRSLISKIWTGRLGKRK